MIRANSQLSLRMAALKAIALACVAEGREDLHYIGADLPDAMTFIDGRRVVAVDEWEARRAEIKKLWCDYYIGRYPDETPALLSAKVVKSTKGGGLSETVWCSHSTRRTRSLSRWPYGGPIQMPTELGHFF